MNNRYTAKLYQLISLLLLYIVVGAFLTTHAAEVKQNPAINHKQFLSDYQQHLRFIIDNYRSKEDVAKKEASIAPLDAQVFDISNNSYLGFLTASTGYRKPAGDALAMMYYPKFQVNQKETAFCFILYDSKSSILSDYVSNTLLGYKDSTIYLALHEMGHCIYAHQRQLGAVLDSISPKQNEQLADMFSIAYFSSIGQKENAVKIIRQTKKLPANDIHHNPEILERFYIAYNDKEPHDITFQNFEALFKATYELYLQLSLP